MPTLKNNKKYKASKRTQFKKAERGGFDKKGWI